MDIAISDTNSILSLHNSEEELVERAKYDRKAFAQLYKANYSSVAGYLYRRTGDTHITEDLVSEVFIAVLRYLPSYRQRKIPFKYWLYRIATNTANRWVRTHQRKRKTIRFDQIIVDKASESDNQASHDSHLATNALLQLSPGFQSVLVLYHIEELSIKQISLVLKCRPGTVKSRLSRAREALHITLEKEIKSNE